MRLDDLLDPKIHIVAGKGGVGKTTVAAVLALVAARHGRKVCVAEVDHKGTLARLFGGNAPSYEPSELVPGVWGVNIRPEQALAEYLDVQYHMKRISRVFSHTHFLDYITTAAPGLKDILVLGKIWYLEEDRSSSSPKHRFDLIVVDAPAAGHMRSFLAAPLSLSDAVRVGPIRRQSDWLVDMLRDPTRTRAHLVTLAEEMPVAETIETSQALHMQLGIDQGVMFANGVYSRLLDRKEQQLLRVVAEDGDVRELASDAKSAGITLDSEDLQALVGYEQWLDARRSIQTKQLARLKREAEAPILELPFLFSAGLGLPDIEALADVVEERIAKL